MGKEYKKGWVRAMALICSAIMLLASIVPAKANTSAPSGTSQQKMEQEMCYVQMQEATAGQVLSFDFTIEKQPDKLSYGTWVKKHKNRDLYLSLSEYGDAAGVYVSLYRDGKTIQKRTYIAADDERFESDDDYFLMWKSVQDGNYTLKLEFDKDIVYSAYVCYKGYWGTTSCYDIKVTKGFTNVIPFIPGSRVINSSIYDESALAIDKVTGKVTGKKVSKQTIDFYLSTDIKYTIDIDVVKNQLKHKKPTNVSKAGTNRCGIEAYQASYDNSGNLVVQAALFNNTEKKVTRRNIKMTVKTADGDLVGSCTQYKNGITIPAKSIKYVKFTIKKSALKLAKVDIRTASYAFTKLENTNYETYKGTVKLPNSKVRLKKLAGFNNSGVNGFTKLNDSAEENTDFWTLDQNLRATEDVVFGRFGTSNTGSGFVNFGGELDFFYGGVNQMPEFSLRSVKDGYILYLYHDFNTGSKQLSKNMVKGNQDVLYTMLASVSSTPDKLYKGVYDMVYGKKLYYINDWHTFGDCRATYVDKVTKSQESMYHTTKYMIYIKQR